MLLPSTRSLEAFIAVARHGRFSSAAATLNLSVPALSRRIALLERDLGATLFERLPRGVVLTVAGAAYFTEASAAIDRLRGATAALQRNGRDLVRVSTIPAFATRWLLPRLPRFAEAHPDVVVDVQTATRLVDLEVEDMDLAIRLEDRRSSGLAADLLLSIDLLPVWCPGYVIDVPDPADLAAFILLGPDHRPEFWAEWFRAQGVVKDMPPIRQVDNLLLYELAMRGGGVAIGIEPLVTSLLREGRLVGQTDRRVRSSRAFHLLSRSSSRRRRAVHDFRTWLESEAHAECVAQS